MAELQLPQDPRVLCGLGGNEDAAVVSLPPGKALVQTLDFFPPIVNDPYSFGQIAAANALSDVYAMGGEPYTALNIVCFPVETMDRAILREILRGGLDKIREAGALLVGGHSITDPEIKYGLSVSGLVDPQAIATNSGLQPGDALLLTKPLGTGILATAVKAKWPGFETLEAGLCTWAARLNRLGGEVIRDFGLRAATDVTGFGLGGHVLEMARASGVTVVLESGAVPVLPEAQELAGQGLVPQGTYANRNFCTRVVQVAPGVDPVLLDLIFDAQTSGGLVLGVPQATLQPVVDALQDKGEPVWHIGRALPQEPGILLRIA